MPDTVLNVGSSLNYNNDYETYVSSPSYQTVNAIKNAGPSPMTTYGPEGNWVEIFSPAVYSTSTSTTAVSDSLVSVLIGEQTTGINQNLPGSSVYQYYNSTDGTRTNLFSLGNVQLNLQLQVTGLSTTATPVQSIQFYIALNDPSAVIWNPNNSVTALALDNVINTSTTYTTIPFQTCFNTSTSISATTPVGATVNYKYAVTTAPTTDFTTGTQLYPAGQTVTDVTTKDGYYAMTVAITQLSSASINTTIPTTADNILPQLNSKNGKVFSVTVTLPYYQSTVATETTNYYVDVSSTTTPLYLNIPLVGYYAAPTYSAY